MLSINRPSSLFVWRKNKWTKKANINKQNISVPILLHFKRLLWNIQLPCVKAVTVSIWGKIKHRNELKRTAEVHLEMETLWTTNHEHRFGQTATKTLPLIHRRMKSTWVRNGYHSLSVKDDTNLKELRLISKTFKRQSGIFYPIKQYKGLCCCSLSYSLFPPLPILTHNFNTKTARSWSCRWRVPSIS